GGAAASAMTGFPYVAKGQGKVIRVGMPTILSGRVAILGESSRAAAQLAVQEFNAAGGSNGRKMDPIPRDPTRPPHSPTPATRDLINSDGCDIIIYAEASSGSFAVQEVIRSLPVLCIHTCSETSSLSADPAIRVPTAFRSARQGIHDAVGGGRFAADLSKK